MGLKVGGGLLLDAFSVTVLMELRDQMWICRLASEYKNMRMFTRQEGAGVEILRLDIEPWILVRCLHTSMLGL